MEDNLNNKKYTLLLLSMPLEVSKNVMLLKSILDVAKFGFDDLVMLAESIILESQCH